MIRIEDPDRWGIGPPGWLLLCAGTFLIFKLIRNIRVNLAHLWRSHFTSAPLDKRLRGFGPWAVITGCTSGIGLGMTREMAKHGMNIVLVSRTRSKLEPLAKEIEEEFKVKTKIIVANAFDRDSNEVIIKEMKDMDIGVLVNNVGITTSTSLCSLHEIGEDWIWEMVKVNAGTASVLMAAVLPDMMRRGRGIVINMCSTTNIKPIPFMSLYGATKIYLDTLSRSANKEARTKGVYVQSLCPYLVQSNMTAKIPIAHRFWSQSSEQYAKHSLGTAGIARRTTGFWLTDILIWVLRICGVSAVQAVTGVIMRLLKNRYS